MSSSTPSGGLYDLYYDEALLARIDRGLKPRSDEAILRSLRKKTQGSPQVILDIGCGRGDQALYLAELFPKALIAGVDAHSPSIQHAGKSVPAGMQERLLFIEADGMRLPFEAKSTDLIWSFDTFCHLRSPAATLREWRRVLRDRGTLVFCSALCTSTMDPVTWKQLAPLQLHRPAMTRDTIRDALQQTGWKRVEEENLHSELLEHIEQSDPGRVTRDFMRLGRLLRCPDTWKTKLGEERYRLLCALILFNLSILNGRLDYVLWHARPTP